MERNYWDEYQKSQDEIRELRQALQATSQFLREVTIAATISNHFRQMLERQLEVNRKLFPDVEI